MTGVSGEVSYTVLEQMAPPSSTPVFSRDGGSFAFSSTGGSRVAQPPASSAAAAVRMRKFLAAASRSVDNTTSTEWFVFRD